MCKIHCYLKVYICFLLTYSLFSIDYRLHESRDLFVLFSLHHLDFMTWHRAAVNDHLLVKEDIV